MPTKGYKHLLGQFNGKEALASRKGMPNLVDEITFGIYNGRGVPYPQDENCGDMYIRWYDLGYAVVPQFECDLWSRSILIACSELFSDPQLPNHRTTPEQFLRLLEKHHYTDFTRRT